MNKSQKAKSVSAFDRAVIFAGGQGKLSKGADISQANVSRIRNGKRPISGEEAVRVEAFTGVSREYLRPDLWGMSAPSPKAKVKFRSGRGAASVL